MSHFDESILSLLSDDDNDMPYPYDAPFHIGDKYLYDYQWYHEKFPEDWAICPKEGTGPGQCENCTDYGCINGIFIGYCVNCALYDYDGSRGRGFINVGVEYTDNEGPEFPSIFDTYLKDVDIYAIQPIESDINYKPYKSTEYNEDDYVNAEPYEDNSEKCKNEIGIMDCQFDGGYNDF